MFWFFIQQTGYVLRGGYYTYKTNYITPFPVPEVLPRSIVLSIEKMVNNILDLKKQSPGINTSDYEIKIDILIYELYEITNDEVNIINETLIFNVLKVK